MKNNDYIFNLFMCDVTEELLNSVAEITDCKQFILCMLIQKVTDDEIIHNEKQSFFLELIHLLQNTDVLIIKM